MKLEFESNVPTFPSVETDFANHTNAENNSAVTAQMLNAGIKAAQEGRRGEARNLLLRVTEMDSENENAWLWLASISEYPEELLVFLNSVLKINPENERALEWAKATKTLLSKTFVQRGIEASKEFQKDFAKQCFLQGIVHDNQNEMAWLWLASVSDTDEEKSAHLQKVLSINPENVTARASLKSITNQMSEIGLQKAFAAAVEGENEQAMQALDEVFKKSPEMEDAWILKSFLLASCAEKVACFERILDFNPANSLALANLAFLRSMPAKVEAEEAAAQMPETEEAAMETVGQESEEEFLSEDKNPTQELEFPQSMIEENDFEDEPQAQFEEVEAQIDSVEMEEVEFEAQESVAESFDAQTEFLEQNQVEEAETAYAGAEESFDDEAQNQVELIEEDTAESFEESENEAESAVEDFADVEEVAQVYAFQEQEISAQPAVEETEAEEMEAIHETEPAGFYSDFEEETENPSAQEDSQEAYEIEADELLSMDTLEENDAEELESSVAEEELEAAQEFAAEELNGGEEEAHQAQTETSTCPFCYAENEPQAFVCDACCAVLTLSDLELLLAGQDAHKDIISDTIEQIEKSKSRRDLDIYELKLISIGYFNLKNTKKGILYLNEAARLNPDDILLSSQVNALKIRLSEIEKQQSIHNSMPKNRTILVVDDSATVRKLISGKLEKCGHEVVCAIDGVDALEKLKEISPDLILLDINMPRMDGYQVCKMIRGDDAMKDTPIVMISGKDGFFDKVRGRMAGTTGYITKPFGPETLMKMVETYIVQPV
jgi:CheY-like chemotaxis protein